MPKWSEADITGADGKTAVVSGGNSGIGYDTARALAASGAHVVIACRDARRGEAALRRLLKAVPGGRVELAHLDLADLDSIRACASGLRSKFDRLDLLVNNAGVMAVPERRVTANGFELQFGSNHLGHFAFTGLLFPSLLAAGDARVVTVSSILHRNGTIDFDDLQAERAYSPGRAYAQSKLANLMFSHELHRRAGASSLLIESVAAHPGWTATKLQTTGARMGRMTPGAWAGEKLTAFLGQPSAMGALPTLFAAVSPDASSGGFYGPDGFMELRGHPAPVRSSPKALVAADAARLWDVSEALTGVRFSA